MTPLLARQIIMRLAIREVLPPEKLADAERRIAAKEPVAVVLQSLGARAEAALGLADLSLAGSTLGRFRLDELIGCGGMGTVYRARQLGLERNVAVKVIDARSVADPTEVERFRREAQAACRLDHPNVIQPIDFGEEGTLLYLAMEEFAGGGTAERKLALRGPFSEGDAFEMIEGVARALDYAAQQGLVHRDVKPANIFYSGAGIVKLGDLGLVLDRGANRLTAGYAAIGTAVYMAPEQALAKPLEIRADVYALGVAAYEVLAGVPPFTGKEPIDVVAQHLRSPPPDVRERRPDVSEALAKLLLSMMAKDPAARPTPARVSLSVSELRTLLSTVRMSAPVPAAVAAALAAAPAPTPSSTTLSGSSGSSPALPRAPVPRDRTPVPVAAAPPRGGTRKVFLVVLAPLFLALGGAGIAAILSGRPPPIDAAAEAKAVDALRAALLERRDRAGDFGETIGEPADPWVSGQALEALLLLEDTDLRRRLAPDIERLPSLALDGEVMGRAPGFAGFPYTIGDTTSCIESTAAVGRAVALAFGRVEADPTPLARSLLDFLIKSQTPSGAYATIPAMGEDGAMTSATTDAISAMAALSVALGEEHRALPAVERAVDWLAARYDQDENFFPVNPRRPSGAARQVPGLDESAALALLDARALARKAGAEERPAARRVLEAVARRPSRSRYLPDTTFQAVVEDYRFQRFLPPGQRTTASEFAWLPATWRLVLASQIAGDASMPRREEWALEGARLRAVFPKAPDELKEVPATWRVAEALQGVALVRAAERAQVAPNLVSLVRPQPQRNQR